MTVRSTCLGFPRIGAQRELKKAQEAYWGGRISRADLLQTGRDLRLRHWRLQQSAGTDDIPCNDFSFYDHVLDMACLLGCIPSRYHWAGDSIDLDAYFAMARGSQTAAAMEMTKWFDTNYHYLVPEFEPHQQLRIASTKLFDELAEAHAAGIGTVPVLIGPVTFALLGKAKYEGHSLARRVDQVLPVYGEILKRLHALGARVQIDEPCLVTDLTDEASESLSRAYAYFSAHVPALDIRLATYFGPLGQNAELAFSLPVAALHIDLARAPGQLEECLNRAAATDKRLVLGLIDGRNVWRNDLGASLNVLERAVHELGSHNVAVAPSCSMLHVPVDLSQETALEAEIRQWLAFAQQKLEEVATLKRGHNEGREAVAQQIETSDSALAARRTSARIHDPQVKQRTASVTVTLLERSSGYTRRREQQRAAFGLPPLPTTTIGSFPQTAQIREARAAHKAGRMNDAAYETAMQTEIEEVIRFQERIGIDVLVHGEAERNDMVEYFGEQLQGYTFSRNGWVQSYGSRCVKPPILYGDVARPRPMTVKWSQYAQSLTPRIVKGMLTGPITLLQWSFVRDDQPRAETCRQIALAIRDEVADLERAGIRMIQIDEPALREGLPLRRSDRKEYLQHAVDAFRLAAGGVQDQTQIHTHMCYSEFNDIIESVAALDADVLSIETSRSQMELLDAFEDYQYPNEIGPGVYDIHSPRVPTTEQMLDLLQRAHRVLRPEQIWVNPDCGLKTRAWPEVERALQNMVAAAHLARRQLAKGPP